MSKKFRLPIMLLSLGIFSGVIIHELANNDSVRLLAEDETVVIHLGDKVTVKDRKLSYNDETKDVQGIIKTPSGGVYQGREFTANEHGQYQVIYEAYFGHHLEKRTINYMCERRGIDYFVTNDSASVSYGEFRYNTSKFFHQGVIIDVKNGAEIKFTEPLDMNDFLVPQTIDPGKTFCDASTGKTANSIIDLIVDPTVLDTYDFTAISIKLTDTEDPDNYVEIVVKESGFTDPQAGALSYAKVGFSGGFSGGWEYNWQTGIPGDGKFGLTGTGIALSYKGQAYQDILHSGQFLFDYVNKRFYTYPGSLSHNQAFFMNDLDNPDYYKANGWTGFKNDKCYVSITPYNFSNSTGRLVIKSVGKYSFASEKMPDEEKPVININYDGYQKTTIPKAIVNEYYPIFSSRVSDNFDSDLKASVSVTYRDIVHGKNINVTTDGDKFFVDKKGTYYINYNAKDRSGNEADTVSLRVDTLDSYDDIELILPSEEDSCYVLSPITFPDISTLSATGGSGNIKFSYEVLDPNGEVVNTDINAFTPNLVGNYRVIYRGTDYIGHTGEKTFTIHSMDLEKPIFLSNISVPRAMIKGFTYYLDPIESVETVNHVVTNVETEILVDEEPYSNCIVASGDMMVIKYCAYGYSGINIQTFNIPVIDVSSDEYVLDQSKYFYGDFISTMNRDDVTLSFDSDGSSMFVNRLDSSAFLIDMNYVDGYDKFTHLGIKFIDYRDFSKTVTMDIDLVKEKLSLPGFSNLAYAISRTYSQISMSYNDLKKQLYDTSGNNVATLTMFDDRQPFTGFDDGFYIEISVSGVSAPSLLKVTKINNQVLGYKEGSGDEGKPTIRLNESFIGTQYIGDEFRYPSFEAYDVFSEIDSVEVTITRPNGPSLKGDDKQPISFIIDSFGRYGVTYTASDKIGNTARINNAVFVYDNIPPVLTVAPLAKNNYSLKAVVKIPTYEVSDDSGYYCVDVILVMPTNETRILTHDENGEVTYALTNTEYYNSSFIVNETSFRAEMKGRYRLRYVAYDEEFNKTVVEYTFYVS